MCETQKTNLFLSLYGVDKSKGCIVITGSIGTEKTTICRMVLENITRKTESAWTLSRFTSENDLLRSILQNFGITGKNTKKRTRKEMIYQLTQLLLKALDEEERALLVIEDTQNLPLPVSEQMRIISGLETQKKKLVQVILVGQDAHTQNLKSPKLEQFYNLEKCTYRVPRSPIKEEKIENYLEHHLMRTDSTGGIHFSPEALEHIRKNSLGIPCITNLIFDCELTGTFTHQNIETKEEIVENAIENLTLQREETETALPEKTFTLPTRIKEMRKSVFIPAVTATSVTTCAFLSKKSSAWLTRIKGLRKSALIPAVTAISVATHAFLSKKPSAWLTRIKGARKSVLIPAVTAISVATHAFLSKKPSAWLTRIKGARKSLLIPAIAAISVTTGAICFFISQNVMTKRTLDHKQEEQAILYSHNIMTEKNFGNQPEQELPGLQEKKADSIQEELKKIEQFELAVSYQESGDFIKAREQYEELIKRYPSDHEIHHNLGSVYQELGDFDAAIKEYEKAILIKPDYHEARNNLGFALYKKGDLRSAMHEFKIILDANSKDVQCITNLGVLSKKLNYPERAILFFEQALSIDPAYPIAHYNLGIILEENEIDRAIFHFEKFLEFSGGRYASLEEEVTHRLERLSDKPKKQPPLFQSVPEVPEK
ncbi:MAG: tetratricopeptide repeat protein [Candidatus Scalindua sp.]|nr:tetratricopeptide repeat protein [Candidatus Scalindua sp.]